MKRLLLLGLVAAVLSLGTWAAVSREPAMVHADTGPTISVGQPTLSGSTLVVPIETTGSGFGPYNLFYVHLRWDPANFAFDYVSRGSGLFSDPNLAACDVPRVDSDGAGVSWDCTFTGSNSLTTTGLLAQIALVPLQTGCSLLHLVTFGPPDYGGELNGTFTGSALYYASQTNAYEDRTSTQGGSSCVTGTPTPGTPLATATTTPTATSTPSSGPTPTPINQFVGPTIIVGTPTFDGSLYHVPVLTGGTGFNAYVAFNVHLQWDSTLLSFVSASGAGGLFDQSANGIYCPQPIIDPAMSGVVVSCVILGGSATNSYTRTGLLTTITLQPLAFGCSTLHLATVGPPDNAGSTYGTYTISISSTAQTNALIDGSACNNPPPTATPTDTPTATPTLNPAESWDKVPATGNLFLTDGTQTFSFDEVMMNQHDPNGFGAFSFDVHFDPTQFTTPTIDLSPAVALFSASGRVLTCNIGQALNGLVHVACASTGAYGTGPQWTGPQVIAHVNLAPQSAIVEAIRPNKENGDVSVVKDDQVTVTNSCGQPLNDGSITPVAGQPECQGVPLLGVGPGGVLSGNPNGGETTVTIRRLEGDITADCRVDIADMQLEASKFGTSVGSLLYSEWYDVNEPTQHGDGEIDVNDIQFVYGRFGSTCRSPVPPQPPKPAP